MAAWNVQQLVFGSLKFQWHAMLARDRDMDWKGVSKPRGYTSISTSPPGAASSSSPSSSNDSPGDSCVIRVRSPVPGRKCLGSVGEVNSLDLRVLVLSISAVPEHKICIPAFQFRRESSHPSPFSVVPWGVKSDGAVKLETPNFWGQVSNTRMISRIVGRTSGRGSMHCSARAFPIRDRPSIDHTNGNRRLARCAVM
eukprot:CAMPEP_0194539114 /NCGR_PEP_ID=MMETSP0253-20130528/78953_1 /TAXON_ID=2966 /ORGANISM="Noctiluca scintillans" /LENGTH=196 /DNA_ID=CAMNT_0039385331 /DNA_START=44 /DNA_END=631 /DNA_ORIENTATION=-